MGGGGREKKTRKWKGGHEKKRKKCKTKGWSVPMSTVIIYGRDWYRDWYWYQNVICIIIACHDTNRIVHTFMTIIILSVQPYTVVDLRRQTQMVNRRYRQTLGENSLDRQQLQLVPITNRRYRQSKTASGRPSIDMDRRQRLQRSTASDNCRPR